MDTLKNQTQKVKLPLKDFGIKPGVCPFSVCWNTPTVSVKLLEMMEVWVPFRSISLLKLQPHPRAIEQTVLFTGQVKVQGVLTLRMCTVHCSSVSMPGWFYQKTPLCRKALTCLGQSTALSLGRTAGKAPLWFSLQL